MFNWVTLAKRNNLSLWWIITNLSFSLHALNYFPRACSFQCNYVSLICRVEIWRMRHGIRFFLLLPVLILYLLKSIQLSELCINFFFNLSGKGKSACLCICFSPTKHSGRCSWAENQRVRDTRNSKKRCDVSRHICWWGWWHEDWWRLRSECLIKECYSGTG